MLRLLPLFLLFALTACASGDLPPGNSAPDPIDEPPLGPGLHELTIEDRPFLVHVPATYDAGVTAPVLFLLHGGFGNAEGTVRLTGFNAIADREGIIAVYPQGAGLVPTWNAGTCCGYARRRQIDDVGFHAAILAVLKRRLAVNPQRIFAAGISNGGMMAYRLACELTAFRGAIGIAASHEFFPCERKQTALILHFHGTEDMHVPWNGGVGDDSFAGVAFSSVAETMAGWRQRNQCSSESEVTFRKGSVVCERALGCAAGGQVELCRIEGGGHTWPGGRPMPGLGVTTGDIDASDYLARRIAEL